MKQQLTLITETGSAWHLDERTRTIGRTGIASAREILQDARRRQVVPDAEAA